MHADGGMQIESRARSIAPASMTTPPTASAAASCSPAAERKERAACLAGRTNLHAEANGRAACLRLHEKGETDALID
jgi:hypothetical protein